jgi:hypothetical protein
MRRSEMPHRESSIGNCRAASRAAAIRRMLSPDGAYLWNGREWVPNPASGPTVSPDGAYVWNGTQWVPNVPRAQPAGPASFRREPTSWTRPLQLAIIALTVVGDLNVLALLPYLSDYIRVVSRRSIEISLASQPQTPSSDEIRAQALAVADAIGTWVVVLTIVIAVLWLLLTLFGALRRWTWFYWLLVVIFGLSILGIPQQVLQVLGVGTSGAAGQPAFLEPLPNALLGLAVAICQLAIFVWMIVAYRKFGPWATRNVPAT